MSSVRAPFSNGSEYMDWLWHNCDRYTCPVCLKKFKRREDCIRHINTRERTKEPLIVALPLEELVEAAPR